MSSRRHARMASAIRESVSSAILLELKDPRVQQVTVTGVEVAGDFRSARVRVSVMGDKTAQSLSLHGLRSARGFLQARIAQRLETRYTPVLEFELDDGVQRSFETAAMLRDLALDPEHPDSLVDPRPPTTD